MGEIRLLSSSLGRVSTVGSKTGRGEQGKSSCAMVASEALVCSVNANGQKGQEFSNGKGPSGGLLDRSFA